MAKTLLRQFADILWPPRSLVSGARGIGKGPLTPAEFTSIPFISGPVCNACGSPAEIDLGADTICAPCTARPPRWHRARAAMVYEAASRRPVLDLKRSGRRDGLTTLAGWMLMAGRPLVDEADILVPVPLHYRRLASRGFNQSAWLADAIAAKTGTRTDVGILKRVRATPTQGGLSARARHRNVEGAFRVRKSALDRVKGRRILLIDDVLTTGATLTACTKALYKAGAANVDVLVLARVVRERDTTI